MTWLMFVLTRQKAISWVGEVDMTANAADVHTRRQDDDIKIWFRFVPREGWLPYDTEGLWAARLGSDSARIRNVPFLQDGVAEDDIVRFETDAQGVHWSRERIEASGNCVVRVLPVPGGPLGRNAEAVHAKLTVFGLTGEVFSADLPLVAFTVPSDADFVGVKALLERGRIEGWWHYEVGSATERWRSA